MRTADLSDTHPGKLAFLNLPFRNFGGVEACAGPVQTVRCFEDNRDARAELSRPGAGRVLVIDGGGQTAAALVGDNLAAIGIESGWAGIVLNGAVRDTAALAQMPLAVFALSTSPVKCAMEGWGRVGGPVRIGGVELHPGGWLYADGDGLLYAARAVH